MARREEYLNANAPKESSSINENMSTEQKRRRVTRACDNCRQKKVKCDGKQPCIHCTVYSYNCRYDQPNIRNKKNLGIPKVTNNHEDVIANTIHLQTDMNTKIVKLLFPKLDVQNNFDFVRFQKVTEYVMSKGGLNVNEVNDLYYSEAQIPSSLNYADTTSSVGTIDDGNSNEFRLRLPSKEVALQLIYITWSKACVLFRFYHRPSLLEEVDLLYSMDPSQYGDRQQKFLPFLYSIFACGSLFSKNESTELNAALEDEGFQYFLEARKLIDITNVGGIHSIQTIVMMIIYLQCSARLSTCYSYIGIAMRSALKEGLHRDLHIFQNSKRKLDPIEMDTRKRLFYTIYKMDIYINSLLGLPGSIAEDEFDQEFPVDLDDENVTRYAYLFDKQNGRLSSSECANHHSKLLIILSHIVKQLYPVKVSKQKEPVDPGNLHAKVTDLELELKAWLDQLPPDLKPTDPNLYSSGSTIPEEFKLANYYLHLAFLNCQIMLYRPFIHFISNGSDLKIGDPRPLIRGRNCIKVARMVVKLANKMIDQNLLVGTYWFSMYTIFFSIACLVYYYHFANYNNSEQTGVNYAGILFDDDLSIDLIKKDIEIGKKVLEGLKNTSNSSLRIYNILNNMFKQLNERTARNSKTSNVSSKDIINGLEVESAQSIFQNFDSINSFGQNPPKTFEQQNSNQNFETLFDNDFTKYDAGRKSENYNNQDNSNVSSQIALDSNNKFEEIPNSGDFQPYVPGVFDQLDTQMFGRILPPYMLKSNADSSDNEGTPNSGSFKIVTPGSLDLGDFDMSSFLGKNNLDYLDPFSQNK